MPSPSRQPSPKAVHPLGSGQERRAVRAFFFLLLILFAQAALAETVVAVASKLETRAGHDLIIFDLTGSVSATARPVADPARIIVDLPEVSFHINPKDTPTFASAKLIKTYRYGLFAPGRSRIVIDLLAPAAIIRAQAQSYGGGARLVIELAPTDGANFSAAVKAAILTPPEPFSNLAPLTAAASGKPVVVIDPGHGGIDIGATSKHGEQEKNIVFEFARALQAKITAEGRLQAILTRNEDIFLPLNERVKRARDNNASLFLSIHADTLAEPHVEGATIYTLSSKASDLEAAHIAEKENLADQSAGLERKEDTEDVSDILFDLTRRETHNYSRDFSKILISKWKDAGSLNKNPSRSAGFVVLKAYDVPSVLLELGYLSSEKDLSRLTSSQWREQAAGKTTEAINAYFLAHPITGRPVETAPRNSERPE